MTVLHVFKGVFIFIVTVIVNDVIGISLPVLEDNDHFMWTIHNVRNSRSANVEKVLNTTSGKQPEYEISSPKVKSDGTACYNDTANVTFYCPQPGESKGWTNCCGDKNNKFCCPPAKSTDKQHDVTLDLITALSIVIGFIVAISCCLLLYCCCCQKRSGVHSGKLVWIKRKKAGNKTIYTASDNPDIDDEQEGTELVGFIEQREENGVGSRRTSIVIDSVKDHGSRKSSLASIDHKKHHYHHIKDDDHDISTSPVPVAKHITPTGQVLMVPLINIQGSTPGTSPS